MSLESASSIATLNSSNPAHGDQASTVDAHVRLIKQVLLNDPLLVALPKYSPVGSICLFPANHVLQNGWFSADGTAGTTLVSGAPSGTFYAQRVN